LQAVLDISNRGAITTASTTELSRDEDSVQSLASLATKDGLITYAGINSTQADQNAGKNEHFRSFDIKYPPRKKQRTEGSEEERTATGSLIGKRSLFKPTPSAKSEAYQRLLRLSPAQRQSSGSKRIGAIATGLSKNSELVVFNATTATPDTQDIIARIEPDGGAEIADLDIATAGTNEFTLTYCTDYDLFEQSYQYDFEKKQVQVIPNGPRRIHSMPASEAGTALTARHKFRAVRFLDAQNVIALVNRADKKGAELRVFHLYPTGPASVVLQLRLPSHIKQAVSLDVCALDQDKNGSRQIVVAVAGQDISIETYTLNYAGTTDTFSKFKKFQTFKDVHPQQMTKICFSPFHSPKRVSDPEPPQTGSSGEPIAQKTEPAMHPGPQYIQLASVSYGNTVVVDTMPLSPLYPKDKISRYVLSHPSDEAWQRNLYLILISMIVLVTAFLAQNMIMGPTEPGAGLTRFLPPGARGLLGSPASAVHDFGTEAGNSAASVVASSVPTSIPGKQRLQDLLSSTSHGTKALVIRDHPTGTELSVDAHDDQEAVLKEHVQAKRWDELHENDKNSWKRKLIEAGRWTEQEGETVLKGVMWSSYAGFVGQAAGEVLKEL
jgi:hypothetical protein